MKAILITCFLCSLLISCVQREENPLEGSCWQLLSGKRVTEDTIMNYPVTVNGSHLKNIGRKYYSTIWQDTTLTDTDYWSAGFNGGTYTFKDGIYSEQHLYYGSTCASTCHIGLTLSYNAEFKNDTLFLSHYIDTGKVKKYGNFEKWKKLE